ncbi:hypothetical protein FHG87_022398, partial [Trinorchestia longiramus]
VYKEIPTDFQSVILAIDEFGDFRRQTFDQCRQIAISNAAHFFVRPYGYCQLGKLLYSYCSSSNGDYADFYVAEEFLTDGSPSDGAIVDGSRVVWTMPTRGFRVEAPTIAQIPGFTEEMSGYFVKTENKSYFYTNDGKTLVTDGNYLIDPACYTNSSCGDAIITTAVEAVTLRHIILRE